MPSIAGDIGPQGCYVYAVVPADTAVPDGLLGVDGAAVELVVHDPVAAAVSEVGLDRPPGRSAELRAHGEVVEALSRCGPVVPAQFGGILVDRTAVVEDLLAPGRDEYATLIANLRGAQQFRLRATYETDQVLGEVVRSNPEIRALRERTRVLPDGDLHPDKVRLGELVSAALEVKRREDAELVMSVVRPSIVAEAPQGAGGVDHLHAVALLVEEERVPALEQSLEELAEAVHERIHLALTGPMAPYDFVGGAAWA